ncbi:hypothetical protein DAI22_06g179000 [Oryza sativa Japonica Group]|nr:hypothetical protein DAI22_06g179000 [Oryza sativa Japonica Group]
MVVVVSIFSIVRCMRKEEAAVRATCQEIAVMDIDLRTRPVADPSSFTPMKRFPDQSTHVSQVLTEVSQIQHQPSPRSRVDCGGRGSAAWQTERREESQRSAPFSEPVLGQGLQTKLLRLLAHAPSSFTICPPPIQLEQQHLVFSFVQSICMCTPESL